MMACVYLGFSQSRGTKDGGEPRFGIRSLFPSDLSPPCGASQAILRHSILSPYFQLCLSQGTSINRHKRLAQWPIPRLSRNNSPCTISLVTHQCPISISTPILTPQPAPRHHSPFPTHHHRNFSNHRASRQQTHWRGPLP